MNILSIGKQGQSAINIARAGFKSQKDVDKEGTKSTCCDRLDFFSFNDLKTKTYIVKQICKHTFNKPCEIYL